MHLSAAFRVCVVVPVYDHHEALPRLVDALHAGGLTCWLVDDGSHPPCAHVIEELSSRHPQWLRRVRLARNQGKGAAFFAGLRAAQAEGFTHAVQIDADLQHDPSEIGKFVDAARRRPDAVINGVPQYDASVPAIRLHGRRITTVLVWLHTLSRQIADAMCGFRLYPIDAAIAVDDRERIGHRMEFDSEVIVRLFWAGTPVVNVPTPVTYPVDGVSHFRMVRDNLRMARTHCRLFAGMLMRLPRLLPRRLAGKAP
ncbi:MAG: glycosyltransferase family 2 protein [Burkholderiaceae bacterium]|nr:glycosyltransferase family 2 protein [Burkholderiaceae bacterium]